MGSELGQLHRLIYCVTPTRLAFKRGNRTSIRRSVLLWFGYC